jgi:hypothetical protein
MPIYSQDIRLCATAYVRAESAEEAARLISEHFGEGETAELPTGQGLYVDVSGARFDVPSLPDVSISPAVSFYGPWGDDAPERADD